MPSIQGREEDIFLILCNQNSARNMSDCTKDGYIETHGQSRFSQCSNIVPTPTQDKLVQALPGIASDATLLPRILNGFITTARSDNEMARSGKNAE